MTAAPVAGRRRGRPRKDARPPDSPSTKELIVLSASEAFAARGFSGANLVDIATAAGVTTGAVYCHFRGKPDLLLEVMAGALDSATQSLRDDDGEATPGSLHRWLSWLMDHDQGQLRALIAEIHHAALRDPEVRQLLGDYGQRYVKMVGTLIRRWQAEGVVTAGRDPEVVALLFLTETLGLCTNGALQPQLMNNSAFREVLDDQLRQLLGEGDGGRPSVSAHRPDVGSVR